MVERGVDRDFGEPMPEGRTAIVAVQGPPCFDKCFLGEVFTAVRVAFVAADDGEHPRFVAADEFREFVRRASTDALKQFSIVIDWIALQNSKSHR